MRELPSVLDKLPVRVSANTGVGLPHGQQMYAWSSVLSFFVWGDLDLESDPTGVFLLKSKRKEASYRCSDWDSFCHRRLSGFVQ